MRVPALLTALFAVLCSAACAGLPSLGARSTAAAGAPLPELGVTVHLDGRDAAQRRDEFARIAALGATWVRLGIPWYAVQPDNGHGTAAGAMRALDQTVSDATSAGLHVLLVGDQAPTWAGGGSETASLPDAYGTFMGLMAKHFRGRGGPGGASPAYELMNEPDGDRGDGRAWAPAPQYAAAACSAYRAIKAGDPGTQVLVGSLDVSDWKPWLQEALRQGLGSCFDALSAHPYSGLSVLDDIRSVAADAGRPDATVWVTEFGASTCGDDLLGGCVSEAEQSSRIVSTLQDLRAHYPWVPVAIAYQDRDEPANPRGGKETGFGLWRATGPGMTPKPVVEALRALYRGP
jgi:hypothetical protein